MDGRMPTAPAIHACCAYILQVLVSLAKSPPLWWCIACPAIGAPHVCPPSCTSAAPNAHHAAMRLVVCALGSSLMDVLRQCVAHHVWVTLAKTSRDRLDCCDADAQSVRQHSQYSFRQRCSTSRRLLAFQYRRHKLCTYVMARCRSRDEKSVWSCRRHTGAVGAEFRVLLASNGDLPYSESSGQQRGCSLVRCVCLWTLLHSISQARALLQAVHSCFMTRWRMAVPAP